MKQSELISALLYRKWINKECPFHCGQCEHIKECAWGAAITGTGKVKIVLRVID